MSASHLDRLRKELLANHWIVVAENVTITDSDELNWKIARPNGDTPLTIEFTPECQGLFDGGDPIEDINRAYACDVSEHPEIPHLYFGSKFRGKFQRDVVDFVTHISNIDGGS